MMHVMIPQRFYVMIDDLKPEYNSMVLGGSDEREMFKWLGRQIQMLYREGYPGVLVCSELEELLVR